MSFLYRCDNAARGCPARMREENLEFHVEHKCAYRWVRCDNCQETTTPVDIKRQRHRCSPRESSSPDSPRQSYSSSSSSSSSRSRRSRNDVGGDLRACPNDGCRANLRSNNWKQHAEEKCTYRPVVCRDCGVTTTHFAIKRRRHHCSEQQHNRSRSPSPVYSTSSDQRNRRSDSSPRNRDIRCPNCGVLTTTFAISTNSHHCRSPSRCQLCGLVMPGSFAEHFISACLARTVSCPKCKEKVVYKDLESHLLNKCRERQHTCLKCGISFKEKERFRHDCLSEFTTCKDCKRRILKTALSLHLESECSSRKVHCDHCMTPYCLDLTSYHNRHCSHNCSKCGVKVMRKEKERHILVCTHKKIKCGDCNVAFLRKDRSQHSCFNPSRSDDEERSEKRVKQSDSQSCVVCLDAPRDTAVLPCRHMSFCASCAGKLKNNWDDCPVCRKQIESVMTLFT